MYGAHLTSHGGLADNLNGVMTHEHPTGVFPLVPNRAEAGINVSLNSLLRSSYTE